MTRPSSAKSSLARRWSLVGQMCSSKHKWGVWGERKQANPSVMTQVRTLVLFGGGVTEEERGSNFLGSGRTV